MWHSQSVRESLETVIIVKPEVRGIREEHTITKTVGKNPHRVLHHYTNTHTLTRTQTNGYVLHPGCIYQEKRLRMQNLDHYSNLIWVLLINTTKMCVCVCVISASHTGLTHSWSDTANSSIVSGSLSYRQAAAGEKGHVFWRLFLSRKWYYGQSTWATPYRFLTDFCDATFGLPELILSF